MQDLLTGLGIGAVFLCYFGGLALILWVTGRRGR